MAKINPIQLQKHLKGLSYPASKQDIVNRVKENKADQEVLSTVQQLPDENYKTPADISQAIGKLE